MNRGKVFHIKFQKNLILIMWPDSEFLLGQCIVVKLVLMSFLRALLLFLLDSDWPFLFFQKTVASGLKICHFMPRALLTSWVMWEANNGPLSLCKEYGNPSLDLFP